MKTKKWTGAAVIALFLLLLISCLLDGLKTKEVLEEPEIVASAGEEEPEPETGMYIFQDEAGNSYEAKLLENVSKCRYDFNNLKDDEGIKRFFDEENGIRSELGIDVSEFQGEIDWQQVKEFGIEFVIIRVGYRAYGENGTLVLDAGFDNNIQGAIDAGLNVGVYFFSQAVSDEEAKEEAEYVLEKIAPYKINGPVVFDTEEIKSGEARTDNNTIEQYTNNCIVFCETIKKAGYEPMIYANMKWMAFMLELERLDAYSFWYTDYQEEPQCPYEYEIWQYTENGVVPGIESNVNMNLWFVKE